MISKTYNELKKLKSYDDKFTYLNLKANIGEETFGSERYINQSFYRSKEWRIVRDQVIVRDNGCDLGHPDYPIAKGQIVIHHINPITADDIEEANPKVFELSNLICCSKDTHNAIHYGKNDYLNTKKEVIRRPGDTLPWYKDHKRR